MYEVSGWLVFGLQSSATVGVGPNHVHKQTRAMLIHKANLRLT